MLPKILEGCHGFLYEQHDNVVKIIHPMSEDEKLILTLSGDGSIEKSEYHIVKRADKFSIFSAPIITPIFHLFFRLYDSLKAYVDFGKIFRETPEFDRYKSEVLGFWSATQHYCLRSLLVFLYENADDPGLIVTYEPKGVSYNKPLRPVFTKYPILDVAVEKGFNFFGAPYSAVISWIALGNELLKYDSQDDFEKIQEIILKIGLECKNRQLYRQYYVDANDWRKIFIHGILIPFMRFFTLQTKAEVLLVLGG